MRNCSILTFCSSNKEFVFLYYSFLSGLSLLLIFAKIRKVPASKVLWKSSIWNVTLKFRLILLNQGWVLLVFPLHLGWGKGLATHKTNSFEVIYSQRNIGSLLYCNTSPFFFFNLCIKEGSQGNRWGKLQAWQL